MRLYSTSVLMYAKHTWRFRLEKHNFSVQVSQIWQLQLENRNFSLQVSMRSALSAPAGNFATLHCSEYAKCALAVPEITRFGPVPDSV